MAEEQLPGAARVRTLHIAPLISNLKTGRGTESKARTVSEIENKTEITFECGIGIRIKILIEIEIQKVKELLALGFVQIRTVFGIGIRIKSGTGTESRTGTGSQLKAGMGLKTNAGLESESKVCLGSESKSR
ncbi:hypothetical protein EVAR_29238_1 [Eumeta japonica]|uniref:Uncharacterized protein n=1 Tax=Eumeta variegata TaxID=151549 RepID=A0A4C1VK99_EUMVA|nr:hypothetical protein EVAR_29238_1 [Eumeta japonica]